VSPAFIQGALAGGLAGLILGFGVPALGSGALRLALLIAIGVVAGRVLGLLLDAAEGWWQGRWP
jgi:hypothetical protein